MLSQVLFDKLIWFNFAHTSVTYEIPKRAKKNMGLVASSETKCTKHDA